MPSQVRIPLPSPRVGRWIRLSFWPAVVLICVAVIAPASYSAFNSTTSTPANSLGVGTVALSDDDTGKQLFSATGLKPGSTGTKCVTVTSTGTLPSVVKLYATDTATTKSLAGNVTFAINQGSGGSFNSCSGFTASGSALYSGTLAGFFSANTNYASGLGSWSPAGGADANESRTYQFTYTVSSSAPDSVQGGTATFTLTWETQST